MTEIKVVVVEAFDGSMTVMVAWEKGMIVLVPFSGIGCCMSIFGGVIGWWEYVNVTFV